MAPPKASTAANRLSALSRSFSASATSPANAAGDGLSDARTLLGHLTLEGVRLPVHETDDRARLPREDLLLDYRDPAVAAEILWLMKKYELRKSVSRFCFPKLVRLTGKYGAQARTCSCFRRRGTSRAASPSLSSTS